MGRLALNLCRGLSRRYGEGGLSTPDVGLHVEPVLILGAGILGRLDGSAERSAKVVAVRKGKAAGRAKALGHVIAGEVARRLGLEAETRGAVARLTEILVDGLVIAELSILTKLAEASRHRLGARHRRSSVASVAPGKAISRAGRGALEVVLPVLGKMLLAEVNLEVARVVVVPVVESVDGIADAEEQSLGLEVSRVSQLDRKGKPVVAQRGFPRADLVAVVSGNLRGGLPVIQSEAAGNRLLERDIGDSHRAK